MMITTSKNFDQRMKTISAVDDSIFSWKKIRQQVKHKPGKLIRYVLITTKTKSVSAWCLVFKILLVLDDTKILCLER